MTGHALQGPPLAHASHWIANLLYLAPLILLGAGVLWQRLRDRSGRSENRGARGTEE